MIRHDEAFQSPPASKPLRALAYAMIIAVLIVGYLHKTFKLTQLIALVPDLLSALAVLVIAVKLPLDRFRNFDVRYVVIFGLIAFNFIAGAMTNSLNPGVVVAGIRNYFLAVLFFFLPLVVHYDDDALRKQLRLIFFICLIQFPLALSQRIATDASTRAGTGDYTYGTILNSAGLSIFLLCVTAVAMGLYLKGHVKVRSMLLFLALTLPATMINETKATLFLIPIAFLAPIILSGEGSFSTTMKRTMLGLLFVAGFACIFIPVYDYYMRDRWGYGLIEFYQRDGRAETYLSKGAQVGSDVKPGRVDTIVLPIKEARSDLSRIAFGLGMGNVSDSSLGEGFTGEHRIRYGGFVGPNVSLLLWETGVLGVVLVFWLLYRIFMETLVARRAGGLTGAFAVGWVGVVVLMTVSMVYKGTMQLNALGYLFWFYSGVVSAAAMRVRRGLAVAATTERARQVPSGRSREVQLRPRHGAPRTRSAP
jgi:hypothetical protein